ncbi:hypothetical protein P3T76_012416 [Phytophthora citrophthora]|uniref:Uncharacterized protein n=1 Tax=Phytophthora citrophthora TaxID=4793 RepID=A0AAD9G4Z2_9STRA|nr:hypothetical protein P3T76_012416 [Phytophthora citrophthora]
MADGAPWTLASSLSTNTLISRGLRALDPRRVLMATDVADEDPWGGGRRRLSLSLGRLEPRVREEAADASLETA